jgi:hypothetical protein
MRHTESGGSGILTGEQFLRRIGTVWIAAAATGGLAVFDGSIASAAKPTSPRPTKPPATTSGFTQTLGGPGAPSKITGSVAVAKDDPRVAFRGGATMTSASDNFHLNAAGHEYLGKKLGADLLLA